MKSDTHFRPWFNIGANVREIGYGAAQGRDGTWYFFAVAGWMWFSGMQVGIALSPARPHALNPSKAAGPKPIGKFVCAFPQETSDKS